MLMNYKVQRRNRKCVCVLHLYREYDSSLYWYPLSYSSYIEASERLDETFGCSISVAVWCLVFLICEETYLQDTKPVAEINDLITFRTRQCHSIIIIIKKVPN